MNLPQNRLYIIYIYMYMCVHVHADLRSVKDDILRLDITVQRSVSVQQSHSFCDSLRRSKQAFTAFASHPLPHIPTGVESALQNHHIALDVDKTAVNRYDAPMLEAVGGHNCTFDGLVLRDRNLFEDD